LSLAVAIFDTASPDIFASDTSPEGGKRVTVSNYLNRLGKSTSGLGNLVNELGAEGNGLCDRLRELYESFLNEMKIIGPNGSAPLMQRSRKSCVKSVKEELDDWQARVRKANNHVFNTNLIRQQLDLEMPDIVKIQAVRYEGKSFFKIMVELLWPNRNGHAETGDNTVIDEWVRLIREYAWQRDSIAITSFIRTTKICKGLLEDIRYSVGMLFSVGDALLVNINESPSGKATESLSGTSLDSVQRQLDIISKHIEMSPWRVVRN